MDSILQSLLDSQDETERERLFDEITLMRTAPLVRKILRQKLGFYITPDGSKSNYPDARDLYNKILFDLKEQLRDLQAELQKNPPEKKTSEKKTSDDYKQFVIKVATNECQAYLCAKSHPRARLKNNLRGLLRRHKEFKVWENDNHASLCGFAAWEGRRISIASSARLARLKENPELFKAGRFAKKNLQEVHYTKLITETFKWLGDPIEFEDLVELIALFLFRGVEDRSADSIESADEDHGLSFTDPAPRADERLIKREMLMKLWEEVKQLPPNYRIILCLSPVGEECEELWNLLLMADVVSLSELADGLEISLEQLMDLWVQLPINSAILADYLGVTRSQVGKWRFRAEERLRERLSVKN